MKRKTLVCPISHITTRIVLRLIALSCATLVLAAAVGGQTITKELATGVTLTQKIVSSTEKGGSAAPLIINVLMVDPKTPGVRVQAVLAQDRVFGKDPTKGRETVSSMARRLNAIAVVNADFFPYTGDALNLHISDGELMSEPNPKRAAFGVTSDRKLLFDRLEFDARITLEGGKWFPVRGVNRPREMHQLVAYTERFFGTTCTTGGGSEAIIRCEPPQLRVGVPMKGSVLDAKCQAGDTTIQPNTVVLSGSGTGQKFIDEQLRPGTSVEMLFNLKPSRAGGWEKVVEAVGGGPWLVRDGKAYVDAADEGFQPGFYQMPHPRTAVGATRAGRLVLVTVDGRQSISGGVTLARLAEIMLQQGCVEAINLDGGGSTTIASSLGVLNSPSDGTERAVANAVAVFGEIPSLETPEFKISADARGFPAGEKVQLKLVDLEGKPLEEKLVARALWSTNGAPGFVDQTGRFIGFRLRKGNVTARIGNRVASIPVEVTPGPPAKFTVRFDAGEPGMSNRSTLAVSVTDKLGNGIPGRRISVKTLGGTPDEDSVMTGKDGKASTGVTWEVPSGGSATVTVEGLPAQTVNRPK